MLKWRRFVPAYWQSRIDRLQKARALLECQEREAEPEENPAAEQADENPIVTALKDIHNDNEITSTKQDVEWDRNDKRERRRFRLDVTAIVVAALAAVFLWRQQNIMQGQLYEMKAQRDMTVAQLRANLRRENFSFSPFDVEHKPVTRAGQKILGWNVSPNWENVGQTDAVDVIAWFKIYPFHYFPLVPPTECPMLPRQKNATPIVIPRSGKLTQLSEELYAPDAQAAANSRGFILISGHIEYRDVFPGAALHQHDWCVIAVPNDIPNNIWSTPIVFDSVR